jgi:hypothetical protein
MDHCPFARGVGKTEIRQFRCGAQVFIFSTSPPSTHPILTGAKTIRHKLYQNGKEHVGAKFALKGVRLRM